MSEDEKGFVIKDRRHFTQEGESEDLSQGEVRAESEPEPSRPAGRGEAECESPPPLPEVNFSTFIFSLSTSALLHLGELPDPNTGENCLNLPYAKQTIDILGMLQEKTRGNLEPDEQSLLSNLLYELRMKYVSMGSK